MKVSDNADLMKLWDVERNKDEGRFADKIGGRTTGKLAWWKCGKGHSWEMAPLYLVNKKYQCPICNNKIVAMGVNDMATLKPEVAAEWMDERNLPRRKEQVIPGSPFKAWWKCSKCGHEWQTAVRHRMERGNGCPVCAKQIITKKRYETILATRGGFNDDKLLLDWDYEKNTVAPSEYSPVSNKKVFWKCHVCGYEWEAKIANRVHGRGCPCCSNKVVVPGVNDLATTDSLLAKQWHPDKNGNLLPTMFSRGAGKKVWWLCPHGHEYQASILHRATGGTNCPICNRGRQTSFRERAFFYYIKKAYPDAISSYRADFLGRFELDIYLPSIHTAIEYDGAAWHKDKANDKDRRKYDLCRANGIKLIRVREAWVEESPHDIADQIYSIEGVEEKGKFEQLLSFVLDQLDPRSNMWTRRDVQTIHSPVDINLERDRYEIMEYLCNVKESLAEMRPELVKEWHPTKNVSWKPNALKWKSERKVWWLCPDCGHEYEATPAHRVEGTGCPKCAKKNLGRYNATLRLAVNSLAVDATEIGKKLLAEWHQEKNLPLTPAHIAKVSEKKVWWKCAKCGYEWEAKLANRYHGRGCPCCSNRVVVRGKNDLFTLYPDLCKEWDYEANGALRPEDVVPGCNSYVWWICSKCGHKYKAPPNRRTSAGSGCRKCADKNNWNIRRDNPKNLPK